MLIRFRFRWEKLNRSRDFKMMNLTLKKLLGRIAILNVLVAIIFVFYDAWILECYSLQNSFFHSKKNLRRMFKDFGGIYSDFFPSGSLVTDWKLLKKRKTLILSFFLFFSLKQPNLRDIFIQNQQSDLKFQPHENHFQSHTCQ